MHSILNRYGNISSIIPDIQETWKNKIFLTFDIDWAHDDVISDCYELVSNYSVNSTWFVTHRTKILDVFRSDDRVELGIHPNFNGLHDGSPIDGAMCSKTIINNLMNFVPEAVSVRSHSLTQSERLIDQFLSFGLTQISNLYIPYGSYVHVRPFYLWDKAVIVPHRFQDNATLRLEETLPHRKNLLKGFHVFDFHPIHVFLNTESLDRYERTRPFHQNPSELIKHRYEGYGTRNRLIELLNLRN